MQNACDARGDVSFNFSREIVSFLCSHRVRHALLLLLLLLLLLQMRKEFQGLQANPVKVYSATEAEIFGKFGNKLFLGYTFSLLGGVGLARWLAKRRTSGYRPGLIGQLSLTMLVTVFGGAANGKRIAPAFFAELINTPSSQSGRMLCAGVLQMGPCMQDTECRRIMSFGSGKHLVQWYEVSSNAFAPFV
jgi:hypothetical protein